MNILLWVLQILLALHTLIGALWKFSNSEQTVPSLAGIPHGVWLALIAFELLCSAGLVVPPIHKPLRVLAPLAAAGIAAEMLSFIVIAAASSHPDKSQMTYWLVVTALAAVIVYGRFLRGNRWSG